MNLLHALRLDSVSGHNPSISLAGAGGKTSTMFKIGREFLAMGATQVLLSATTHLGTWQATEADHHIFSVWMDHRSRIEERKGLILVTGEKKGDRFLPVEDSTLQWLHDISKEEHIPLIIEADGSRMRSLKAPAEHEPAIPNFSETVIYLVGLSVLGKPLNAEYVHRPDQFSGITNLALNSAITPDSITRMLTDPRGGLKRIPPTSRRIAFLNQADTPELQSMGGNMTDPLLDHFDSVLVGSLQSDHYQTFERTAGVILAAGESKRFGKPKQLLDWKGKPFIRQVAETALFAGLSPVIVVTGHSAYEVAESVRDLPVEIIQNSNYRDGQGSSIRRGVECLPSRVGGAIFLLADQPQIPVDLLRALVDFHTHNLNEIVAPLVLEERRANPVLFDRSTFNDLMQLSGDVGGRAIFDRHRIDYLPWHDDLILFDVDSPQDYRKLKEYE